MEDSVVFLEVERSRWAWLYGHFVAMDVVRIATG